MPRFAVCLLLFPFSLGCRTTGEASAAKVIGGASPAADNPIAYATVALVSSNDQGASPFCSGTLVGASTVLTAAHCVLGTPSKGPPPPLKYIFFESSALDGTGVYLQVESVHPHPNFQTARIMESYSATQGVFDIAWVKFSGDIPTGYSPMPIIDGKAALIGTAALAGGYGLTNAEGHNTSQTKQFLNVTIDKVDLSNVRRGVIEAKAVNGSSICDGDSGGSLFSQVTGRWQLAGVVSASGCSSESPQIFAYLGAHRKWLAEEGILHLDSNETPPLTVLAMEGPPIQSMGELCRRYELTSEQWLAIITLFTGDLRDSTSPPFTCATLSSKEPTDADAFAASAFAKYWANGLGSVEFPFAWKILPAIPSIAATLTTFPTRSWKQVALDAAAVSSLKDHGVLTKIGTPPNININVQFATYTSALNTLPVDNLGSLSLKGGRNPIDNSYIKIDLNPLRSVTALSSLYLYRILLDDSNDFTALDRIKTLSTEFTGKAVNGVYEIDAAQLAPMIKLESLTIRSARIKNPEALKSLPNLARLWLEHTTVSSCDGLQKPGLSCTVLSPITPPS